MTDAPAHAHARLVKLPPSPWSKRAQWTLAEAGVAIPPGDVVDYVPIVDEPWLRWVLSEPRPWRAVSVPVLVVRADRGRTIVLRGSGEMARFLLTSPDARGLRVRDPAAASASASPSDSGAGSGSGSGTFWLGDEDVLRRAETAAETVMSAGRHLATERLVRERNYADELLTFPVTALPASAKAWLIGFVNRWLQRKYARPEWTTLEAAERDLRAGMDELQRLVREAQPDLYLCRNPATGRREFSYVDIVVAMGLAFVHWPIPAPVEAGMSPGMRRIAFLMTDPALAAEYPDLVAWRDRVFAERNVMERAGIKL